MTDSVEQPEGAQPEEATMEEVATASPVDTAMQLMQVAMKTLTPDERKVLNELRREIDLASPTASQDFDKRLEFCYAVKFSKDRLPSPRLQQAVENYIKAVEG